jgi:hypothetical protein
MPIPVQDTLIEHVGNGVTTVFSYPFTILSSDDLKCKIDGSPVSSGFTVSGVGSRTGGSVTFSTAPASLASVLLYRQVSLDRETDYQENGDLLASVIDDDFDRAWMAIQDLGALNERSLRVPVGEVLNELPAEAERDGYLAFAGGVPVLIDAPSASDASALALNLASTSDASKGAGMQGYGVSNAYVDDTTGKKLQEWKSAYDYGARGVSTVTDTVAINDGIAAIHAAGGGYLIINEFISTSIDLTTLTNQTDVMLIDRRYKSAGHIAHFSTNGDMEYRIHGASVTGGEGPSWVSVNTATTGDRTSSLVSRYGTDIGSSVAMYMHMGVWDGSNWFPEFDMITNGASGFRSNLRVGYGTVGINTGVTGAYNYTQNKIFTVNKPPALGGGALYELSTTESVTYGDVKSAAAISALRLAAADGTNQWSFLSSYPSAGQVTLYDHNTTSNKVVFTSGSDTAITGVFRNAADNVSNLGSASYRWATVYAGTGAINTSDQNEKQDIQALSAAETLVAQDIKALMRRFRFKDAVTAKGDTARLHFGVMAQAVAAAFTAHGLNANDYALFCSDTWEEGGETKTRLGIRYDELLCFVIASL